MEKFVNAHFCSKDETVFAGTHLIIDIWDGQHLGDIAVIEQAFFNAITDVGATLLHMHFHHFGPEQGVSGVAVLQESHISIHSWPEVGYAAIDIFLCGNLDPLKAVTAFKKAFETEKVGLTEFRRGTIT